MNNDSVDRLKWRYATKKFNPNKRLDQAQIDILKNAFNLTATSYGLQTIYLCILENMALREQLLEFSFGQRQIVDASHLLVLAVDKKISTADVDSLFDNIQNIRDTPESILAPYRQNLKNVMEAKTLHQQQEWSIRQAYIALGNLMTVCANEKIDSCPMEGFISNKFDEILGLNERGLNSVLLLPVGYRADDDMFADFKKVRKNLSDIIIDL